MFASNFNTKIIGPVTNFCQNFQLVQFELIEKVLDKELHAGPGRVEPDWAYLRRFIADVDYTIKILFFVPQTTSKKSFFPRYCATWNPIWLRKEAVSYKLAPRRAQLARVFTLRTLNMKDTRYFRRESQTILWYTLKLITYNFFLHCYLISKVFSQFTEIIGNDERCLRSKPSWTHFCRVRPN